MLVYKASIVTRQCFFSLGNLLQDLEETRSVMGPKEYVCKNFFLQYK